MTSPGHVHTNQPRSIMGFPAAPGYPAHPGAADICYAISDGCAACLDLALDEAGDDLYVSSTLVAYTADLLAFVHSSSEPVPPTGRQRSLPADLGHQPTRLGAPVPGEAFVAAATAAFDACPASCAGNGIPAAQHVLSRLSPEDRIQALSDAAGLLGVYQARTERGRDALKALSIHL